MPARIELACTTLARRARRAARRTCDAATRHLGQRARRVQRVQPQAAGRAGDRRASACRAPAPRPAARPRGAGDERLRPRPAAPPSRPSSERSPPLTSAVWLTYRTLIAGRARPAPQLAPASQQLLEQDRFDALDDHAARRSAARAPRPPRRAAARARGRAAAARSPRPPRSGSVGSTSRPVSPSSDRVERAADVAGDDRLAVGAGLQVDDPEALAREARRRAGGSASPAGAARRSHASRSSSETAPRKRDRVGHAVGARQRFEPGAQRPSPITTHCDVGHLARARAPARAPARRGPCSAPPAARSSGTSGARPAAGAASPGMSTPGGSGACSRGCAPVAADQPGGVAR